MESQAAPAAASDMATGAAPMPTRIDHRVARPRNSGGRFVCITPEQRTAMLSAGAPRMCAVCQVRWTTQWRFVKRRVFRGWDGGGTARWRAEMAKALIERTGTSK